MTCLIGLFNDIRHAADQRKAIVCILFEFLKIFDRVQHKILIDKLKDLHLSYSILTWVASYLTGRTQVIRDSGSGSVSNPAHCWYSARLCFGVCIFQLISI